MQLGTAHRLHIFLQATVDGASSVSVSYRSPPTWPMAEVPVGRPSGPRRMERTTSSLASVAQQLKGDESRCEWSKGQVMLLLWLGFKKLVLVFLGGWMSSPDVVFIFWKPITTCEVYTGANRGQCVRRPCTILTISIWLDWRSTWLEKNQGGLPKYFRHPLYVFGRNRKTSDYRSWSLLFFAKEQPLLSDIETSSLEQEDNLFASFLRGRPKCHSGCQENYREFQKLCHVAIYSLDISLQRPSDVHHKSEAAGFRLALHIKDWPSAYGLVNGCSDSSNPPDFHWCASAWSLVCILCCFSGALVGAILCLVLGGHHRILPWERWWNHQMLCLLFVRKRSLGDCEADFEFYVFSCHGGICYGFSK